MIGTDAKVMTRVIVALLEDPELSRSRMEVGVDDSIVTLWGEVLSEEARAAAEGIARRQAGVADVVNKLRIAPAQTEPALSR